MRKFAFLAPLGVVLALASSPVVAQTPQVTVTIGGDLRDEVETLGEREVQEQADRLAQVVSRTLDRSDALGGARIELVLVELKPNRPTFQQMTDRPGLDGFHSVSIGGATIEGQIITASGEVIPVRYDWHTNNISEVTGFTTWQDADRAYARLASNLVAGRYVTR